MTTVDPERRVRATLEDLGITEDAWMALEYESRRLIRSGCLGKVMFGQRAAQAAARDLTASVGEPCRAYRCPFTLTDDHHWHVGHVPTVATIEGIARTIRDLHGTRPPRPPKEKTR